MPGKRIVIGDIHGCCQALKSIIELSGYNEAEDELIFVGDLFDRGKKNAEVYTYVSELKEKNGDKVTLVFGNHEYMLINALESEEDDMLWDYNGGVTTKASFINAEIDPEAVADWIADNMDAYYECPGFIVCHGGSNLEDLEDATLYDLVWDRDTFYLGSRHHKLMIVGHTPIYDPSWKCGDNKTIYEYNVEYELPEKGILNIDTGCVFGGMLTALIEENGHFRLVSAASDGQSDIGKDKSQA